MIALFSRPRITAIRIPGVVSFGSGFQVQSIFRWVCSGLLICVLLASTVQAQWMEIHVEAADEESAVLMGLDRALVSMVGFRSDPLNRLVREMAAEESPDWLYFNERESEQRFRLAVDSDRLWARIQQERIPIWVGSRPSLLVWGVVESATGRELLWSGTDSERVLPQLEGWGLERGFPILVPLGDLIDRRTVNVADIVGGVTEALLPASRRYSPDGVILLHIMMRASNIQARVWISYQGREVLAEALGVNAGDAATRALGRALDTLGLRMAQILQPEEALRVGFSRINNPARLEELRQRLESLEIVRSVRPGHIFPTAVVMELRSAVDLLSLESLLLAEGFSPIEEEYSLMNPAAFWLRPLW